MTQATVVGQGAKLLLGAAEVAVRDLEVADQAQLIAELSHQIFVNDAPDRIDLDAGGKAIYDQGRLAGHLAAEALGAGVGDIARRYLEGRLHGLH